MRKHLALLATVALILVSCEPTETTTTTEEVERKRRPKVAGSGPSVSPTPLLESPSPTSLAQNTLEVWFASGEHLFRSTRSVPSTPAVARAAMEQLLARPTDFEANAGVTTAIPPGTELLGITIEKGVAEVDLSSEFFTTNGSLGEGLAIGQVIYTLTQFPTVEAVSFKIDGKPVEHSPGHGMALDPPQRRKDWPQLMPPIVVTYPTMGEEVSSPLTVTGTADVFEATVQMRLLDAQGKRLARAFTTATCGTGCRGNFEHDLSFEVSEEQHGVLEVWWSSPEDGSREDVVQIAVTLAP